MPTGNTLYRTAPARLGLIQERYGTAIIADRTVKEKLMDVTARLDWSDAHTLGARPVNTVLVQGVGEELILSFGHAIPPIGLASATNEQLVEYLKENPVPVHQIARFTLPIGTARTLMERLQEALGTHDAQTTGNQVVADAEVAP